MIKAFNVYANQFFMKVNMLKDTIKKLEDAFEVFANQSHAEANAMNTHIWRTQEDILSLSD